MGGWVGGGGGGGGGTSQIIRTQAKRSKTHRRLKERFLIGRNRTKRANFRGSPLFQATYNVKTAKQTINPTHLVSVGCALFPSANLPHPTDTR